MTRINDVLYPALKFHGYRCLQDAPEYARFFKPVTEEQLMKSGNKEMLERINSEKEKGLNPAIHVLKNQPNEARLPIFAIAQKDRKQWGDEATQTIIETVNYFWTLAYSRSQIEIVPGYLWDDSYNVGLSEEYDAWLENKVREGYNSSGILIRPKEEICVMYYILYQKDAQIEASLGMHKNRILYHHVNFLGKLTSDIELPGVVSEIARQRHNTPDETFFQEDMYNILRYLFYKEHFLLKPTTVGRGDRLDLQDGIYDIFTDTPCAVYGIEQS